MWKQRYFVLNGDMLTYAKTEGGEIIKIVPLNRIKDVKRFATFCPRSLVLAAVRAVCRRHLDPYPLAECCLETMLRYFAPVL
jgi:hypothetical protein